eukprot:CAMPEP_0206456606 /NCGR_PEP_ID=MMETSP0324_2-20121206/22469_1 /ASSEMBLY_ACC=CAM_ASM_000836 /TAXON_ID=2866 /ORGANISM="Crypthecodinium cohnii, Strain Seligo" /LENGTH=88 /DNA_ID=CAMNT_0053927575 /DNA_START=52 /DNA_END=318 /DNA_ORIENTATION=+
MAGLDNDLHFVVFREAIAWVATGLYLRMALSLVVFVGGVVVVVVVAVVVFGLSSAEAKLCSALLSAQLLSWKITRPAFDDVQSTEAAD